MITITTTETDYFLPEDGQAAEQKFLELLKNFGEVWICAFGFTLQPMFDALKKADAAGAKPHILLDHSQAVGKAEFLILGLIGQSPGAMSLKLLDKCLRPHSASPCRWSRPDQQMEDTTSRREIRRAL